VSDEKLRGNEYATFSNFQNLRTIPALKKEQISNRADSSLNQEILIEKGL